MNDSLIGRQVASYRIDRILGRGGMASVYFAWDNKLDRPVALKVMDERYRDTPTYIDRFIHEAQAIASWDQPNIVKVYDAGEEGGIYYYAMEFVRGLDLMQLLRQYLDAHQLMPYNEVVRVGWAVAEALDYAHAHGVVHRDVKPSNVLISVDGRILLTDFGLVMDVNRGTMGETFGSPAYIAPEQARSSARAVPQSDNYALGVMLYEMLTGQVPFYDSSPTSLALKHLTEEPPRPRALNPRLSPAVEAVLLRALRKRPEERYATGREMMTALERALGSELNSPEATVPQPLAPGTLPVPAAQPPRASYPPAQPAAATAVGASAIPRTEVRHDSYPAPAGSTQVRGMPTSGASVYTGQPRVMQSQAASPANYPTGGYPTGGYAPPGAPPANPPRRSRGLGWGCLGALLGVILLAVMVGAVISAFQPNFSLSRLLAPPPQPSIPPLITATSTRKPTATRPRPTATRVPPSRTPLPSATPITPTATLPPTDTPQPTATPAATLANAPIYNLNLARTKKQDGFVLENTGTDPMPLASLELWDTNNHLLVPGSAWALDNLDPGRCVSIWVTGAKVAPPAGYRCTIVGKILMVVPAQQFWAQPIEIHYNNVPVAVCQPNASKCGFDTAPNP